jgi:hypothetical protein
MVATIKRVAEPEPEIEQSISKKAPAKPREDQFAKSLEPLKKTFNFTTKQWAILGMLVAGTVCVLLGSLLYILVSL